MSLLLRSPPPLLPLIAAVAVCDIAGDEALIKWPNDIVLVRDPATLAKLAGILVEGRPQADWAVLGIGLNVAVRLDELPLELRPVAATLGYGPAAIEPTLERLLDFYIAAGATSHAFWATVSIDTLRALLADLAAKRMLDL